MKIALGLAAIILLAAAPAHGQSMGSNRTTGSMGSSQSIGGAGLTGTTNFTKLTWEPPAVLSTTTFSGTNDFMPSTFVTFAQAIAQGNAAIKEQSKTVVEAAAESRKATNGQPKVVVMQDNNGNVVYRQN